MVNWRHIFTHDIGLMALSRWLICWQSPEIPFGAIASSVLLTNDENFAVSETPIREYPFSAEQPPVKISAMLAPVDWPEEYGVAAVEPRSHKAQRDARAVCMIP